MCRVAAGLILLPFSAAMAVSAPVLLLVDARFRSEPAGLLTLALMVLVGAVNAFSMSIYAFTGKMPGMRDDRVREKRPKRSRLLHPRTKTTPALNKSLYLSTISM